MIWGYHHFRKHPCILNEFHFSTTHFQSIAISKLFDVDRPGLPQRTVPSSHHVPSQKPGGKVTFVGSSNHQRFQSVSKFSDRMEMMKVTKMTLNIFAKWRLHDVWQITASTLFQDVKHSTGSYQQKDGKIHSRPPPTCHNSWKKSMKIYSNIYSTDFKSIKVLLRQHSHGLLSFCVFTCSPGSWREGLVVQWVDGEVIIHILKFNDIYGFFWMLRLSVLHIVWLTDSPRPWKNWWWLEPWQMLCMANTPF